MGNDRFSLVMPRRAILQPLAWVLRSGWLASDPEVIEVESDGAAVEALLERRAAVAIIDPVVWVSLRARLRPVARASVSLRPEATDMLLLSEVRLDGLERVTAPPAIAGTTEEVLARTLVRDYYGVTAPLDLTEKGIVEGEEGRIVAGVETFTLQPYTHVESLSRAWWVMSGTPWVRALPVEAADAPVSPTAEALLGEAARLMGEQTETVARELAREQGGAEDMWLALLRGYNLAYGAEERKGLSALLASAARLRMCPRVEDVALPRY